MARSAPRLTFLTFVIATIVVIGGLVSLLILISFASPGPATFSGVVTTLGNCTGPNCAAVIYGFQSLPARANVTVRWTDVSGGVVNFRILNSSQPLACIQSGTSGVCYFVSVGGYYSIRASDPGPFPSQSPQTVYYNGTYV